MQTLFINPQASILSDLCDLSNIMASLHFMFSVHLPPTYCSISSARLPHVLVLFRQTNKHENKTGIVTWHARAWAGFGALLVGRRQTAGLLCFMCQQHLLKYHHTPATPAFLPAFPHPSHTPVHLHTNLLLPCMPTSYSAAFSLHRQDSIMPSPAFCSLTWDGMMVSGTDDDSAWDDMHSASLSPLYLLYNILSGQNHVCPYAHLLPFTLPCICSLLHASPSYLVLLHCPFCNSNFVCAWRLFGLGLLMCLTACLLPPTFSPLSPSFCSVFLLLLPPESVWYVCTFVM